MRILICGHSFIRRYQDWLHSNWSCAYERSEREFHRNFGLHPSNRVFIRGFGGLSTDEQGVNYILGQVNRLQPEILLLQVGSNDLADNIPARVVSQDVRELCDVILNDTSVKVIVILEIVKRRRFRNSDITQFESERLCFNGHMQRLARSDHRIYSFRHNRSIIVNLRPGRISRDNIHVTTPEGMRLYHFSIRRAVITGLNRFNTLYQH